MYKLLNLIPFCVVSGVFSRKKLKKVPAEFLSMQKKKLFMFYNFLKTSKKKKLAIGIHPKMLYKQICIGRENRILDRISLKLMVFDYVEQTLQTERTINFLKNNQISVDVAFRKYQ